MGILGSTWTGTGAECSREDGEARCEWLRRKAWEEERAREAAEWEARGKFRARALKGWRTRRATEAAAALAWLEAGVGPLELGRCEGCGMTGLVDVPCTWCGEKDER